MRKCLSSRTPQTMHNAHSGAGIAGLVPRTCNCSLLGKNKILFRVAGDVELTAPQTASNCIDVHRLGYGLGI